MLGRVPIVEVRHVTPKLAQNFQNEYVNFIENILNIPKKSYEQISLASILSHISVKFHNKVNLLEYVKWKFSQVFSTT